jgi:hypothetical protein
LRGAERQFKGEEVADPRKVSKVSSDHHDRNIANFDSSIRSVVGHDSLVKRLGRLIPASARSSRVPLAPAMGLGLDGKYTNQMRGSSPVVVLRFGGSSEQLSLLAFLARRRLFPSVDAVGSQSGDLAFTGSARLQIGTKYSGGGALGPTVDAAHRIFARLRWGGKRHCTICRPNGGGM